MRRYPDNDRRAQRKLAGYLPAEQCKTVADFVTQFCELPAKQGRGWLAQFSHLIPDELVDLVSQRLTEGATVEVISFDLANELKELNTTSCEDLIQVVANLIMVTLPHTVAARNIRTEKSRELILHGTLWLIGGGVVTIGSYLATGPGQTYIVAWGAMLWGAIDLIRGLSARSDV